MFNEKLLKIRFILLKIIISITICSARTTSYTSNSIGVKDCFAVSGDSSSIICRTIPKCNENTMRLYHLYNRIIFDLENKYSIKSDQFFNCSFSWTNKIELEFKNIKLIKKYAFESIKLDKNVRLTLKFDGSGLNLDKKNDMSKLTIVKDAFRNMKLDKQSQLFIEIYKYGHVEIQDTMINTIQQEETTELHVNIHDCDELSVTSKQTSDYEEDYLDDDGVEEHQTHGNIFKTNQTFTFEMTHLNNLRMDSNVLEKFKINPYSGSSFIIRYVHNCYLGDMLFRYLMLGPYSQFNLQIESVTTLGMGVNIFDGLYQDQNSVFYMQIDQIGLTSSSGKKSKRSASSSNDYYDDDYYDYEYQQEATFESSFNNWLCIPEGLFKNVRQYESSLAQIQLSQIDMSISVSSKAFSEIQLNENSKFQISFQDINGHILFDRNAINRINVGAGLFEIWTENHKQQDLIRGNQAPFLPKSNGSNQQQPQDTLKTLKIVKNSYFKLMELAINQIYLTSRSFFRFGFVNSNSIFVLNPKSMNGFVIDSFKKNISNQNYQPKIEFEINDSENVKFNFLYKDLKQPNINKQSINNIDYDYDDEDITNGLPKLIEIDGYQPEMSLIKQDGIIDTKSAKKKSTELSLIKEFCQFHTLRPYMASIQRSQSGIKSILTKNLVYFTESIKLSAELDQKPNTKLTCTSCLFIYLYRTIQRRPDFYYVKDHLPQCFINLHFKNSIHFPSVISETERHQLISNIEQSFKYYWKILNCKSITGLDNILDYDEEVNPIDEILSDYDRINKHCKDKVKFQDEMRMIRDMDSNNWHENSLKICSKNVFDSKQNVSKVPTGLRADVNNKNKKKVIIQSDAKSSKTAPMAVLLIIMFGTSFLIIYVYLKYKRPKKPCIRLNFNRNTKTFQRLNNQSTRMPTQIVNNNREDDIEPDLNGYEYDDDFEMNNNNNNNNIENENEEHVEFHQMETTPVKSSPNNKNKLNKSIEKIKKFKNNLFNKNTTSLYTNFTNPTTKYSQYGYNSTDSTLVQTKIKNEFELSPNNDDEDTITKKKTKSNSVVTYDKSNGNQKNLVTKIDTTEILDDYDEDEIDLDKLILNPNHILNKDSMRMATNPMGVLDFELDMDLEMEDIANTNGDDSVDNDEHLDGTVNINKNAKHKNESNA